MTRDDVIRMARDAGLYVGTNISGVELVGSSYAEGGPLVHLDVDELSRFAALVAAAEREACAKVCEEFNSDELGCLDACAAAIRARNNYSVTA